MSDNDQPKPYHARDVSSGQEAADVVADVLKHAAERDEAAQKKTGPKPTQQWMLPMAMTMSLLAIYFIVAQPSWTRLNPIQPPPVTELEQLTRTSMHLNGIAYVDSFQDQNGRLPTSLTEAGAAHVGSALEYAPRADGTYVLRAMAGDLEVVFDSATMTPEQFTGPMNLPG